MIFKHMGLILLGSTSLMSSSREIGFHLKIQIGICFLMLAMPRLRCCIVWMTVWIYIWLLWIDENNQRVIYVWGKVLNIETNNVIESVIEDNKWVKK